MADAFSHILTAIGGASLDLLANRKRLVGDMVVGGCLWLSYHETIEFSVLGEVKRGISKTVKMDFQRANFQLIWASEGKGVQGGRVSEVQGQTVPVHHELSEKMSSLAEQRGLAETQGKKKKKTNHSLPPLEI